MFEIVGLKVEEGKPAFIYHPLTGKVDLTKISDDVARLLIANKCPYLKEKAPKSDKPKSS